MSGPLADRYIVRVAVLFLGFSGYLYLLYSVLNIPAMIVLAFGALGVVVFGGFVGYFLESDRQRESTRATRPSNAPSGSSARVRIEAQMELIESLISRYQPKLIALEQEAARLVAPLSKGGISGLTCARRIISALEERLDLLVQCSKSLERMGYAVTIVDSPLLCRSDSMSAVLDATPIPALMPEHWDAALSSLHTQVEREMHGGKQRAA